MGTERWLLTREDAKGIELWREQRLREVRFLKLLLATRERLIVLYGRSLPEQERRRLKQAEFQRLWTDYGVLKKFWGGYQGYDGWFDRELNNAHLASIATYEQLLPVLRLLLEREGGDLHAFYLACEQLAALSAEARSAWLAALQAGGTAAGAGSTSQGQ